MDDEHFMKIALELAEKGRGFTSPNPMVGAIIVKGGKIVGQGYHQAAGSAHAEVNAIRQAVKTIDDENLCGAVLFSTCEPCPMCSSLAVWANITTIVYGVSIIETANLGKSRIMVSARHIIENSPTYVELIADVLADECKMLYS